MLVRDLEPVARKDLDDERSKKVQAILKQKIKELDCARRVVTDLEAKLEEFMGKDVAEVDEQPCSSLNSWVNPFSGSTIRLT